MNSILAEKVVNQEGITLLYDHNVLSVSPNALVTFETPNGTVEIEFDLVIGTDGGFSTVREDMIKYDMVNISRNFIPHGYKELTIPPTKDGEFALDDHEGLHIWPRGEFMIIALPNNDQTFTCTMFAPYKGEGGFDQVDKKNTSSITSYFDAHFSDFHSLIPNLVDEYKNNPVGTLVTVKLGQWMVNKKIMVMGDSAHALVPFYGQGMNCGFEDGTMAYNMVKEEIEGGDGIASFDNLIAGLSKFCDIRPPMTNALADLSYNNYAEMRDHTTSSLFLLRKTLEKFIHYLLPSSFIPLYTMVESLSFF